VRQGAALLCLSLVPVFNVAAAGPRSERWSLRGQPLTLHLYGERGESRPLIVSSGDGGWVHLGPQVAQNFAERGHFIVGLDSREYLSAFTDGTKTLSVDDVRRDFRALVAYARGGGASKPILVGVSEGAGLSVVAATDDDVKSSVSGVLGLGLPDQNELGWRWRDSVIYVTHKAPNEPSFFARDFMSLVAPVPLALIHSTHDEFVPLTEARKLIGLAAEPSKLWEVDAADHRFSDRPQELAKRLDEALAWMAASTK
jgi:fermentation-respiration switch protein FrsA (DUF1100 family)